MYWSYTDSRIFSIFQYQPIAKTVSPVRAELRFEFFRSRCLGSQSALVCFFAQLIAYRDAQYCMHLVVENKCVTSTCIYHSPRLCGHSVGLVCNCDSRVVYSFFHTTKDLGDPGSRRGTLERVRVDLTMLK